MVYNFNSVTGLLFFEQVVHFFIDIYRLEIAKNLFIQFERQLGFVCDLSETDVLSSLKLAISLMNKEIETSNLVFVSGKGKRKPPFQKLYEKACELYERQCRYTEANRLFNG